MLWFQAGKILGIIFSQTAKDMKSCKKKSISIVNINFKQFLFHSWQTTFYYLLFAMFTDVDRNFLKNIISGK